MLWVTLITSSNDIYVAARGDPAITSIISSLVEVFNRLT